MGFFSTLTSWFRPRREPRPLDASAQMIRARYDAAQTTDDMGNHWANADALDADNANSLTVRKKLRERARYEVANNGYGKGIILTHANYVVGTGPKLRIQADSPRAKDIETKWQAWCKATNFYRKLRTACQAKTTDGEAFLLMVSDPSLADPVSLNIRGIECDQIGSAYIAASEKNHIDGIYFDDLGTPTAYELFPEHPGSTLTQWNQATQRIPAEFICHWFREDRPGQHRGVPEITPSLNLFGQGRRFREAVIAAAETAADFAMFLKTPNAASDEIDLATPFSTMPIEKRVFTALPNGNDVFQAKAEQPATTYEMFSRTILNEEARALNMPYNIAACDSSQYNFSSGKLDHGTYFISVDVDRSDCQVAVLDPVFARWYREAASVYGWLVDDDEATPPHSWDWPPRPEIDPEKTANARKTALAIGATTLDEIANEDGVDWDVRLAALADNLGVDPEAVQASLFASIFGETPASAPTASAPIDQEPTATEAMPSDQETPADTSGGTPRKPAPKVNQVTVKRSALLEMAGGITGILDIFRALAAGEITTETAVQLIVLFYQISREEAVAIVGKSGQQPKQPEKQDDAQPAAKAK